MGKVASKLCFGRKKAEAPGKEIRPTRSNIDAPQTPAPISVSQHDVDVVDVDSVHLGLDENPKPLELEASAVNLTRAEEKSSVPVEVASEATPLILAEDSPQIKAQVELIAALSIEKALEEHRFHKDSDTSRDSNTNVSVEDDHGHQPKYQRLDETLELALSARTKEIDAMENIALETEVDQIGSVSTRIPRKSIRDSFTDNLLTDRVAPVALSITPDVARSLAGSIDDLDASIAPSDTSLPPGINLSIGYSVQDLELASTEEIEFCGQASDRSYSKRRLSGDSYGDAYDARALSAKPSNRVSAASTTADLRLQLSAVRNVGTFKAPLPVREEQLIVTIDSEVESPRNALTPREKRESNTSRMLQVSAIDVAEYGVHATPEPVSIGETKKSGNSRSMDTLDLLEEPETPAGIRSPETPGLNMADDQQDTPQHDDNVDTGSAKQFFVTRRHSGAGSSHSQEAAVTVTKILEQNRRQSLDVLPEHRPENTADKVDLALLKKDMEQLQTSIDAATPRTEATDCPTEYTIDSTMDTSAFETPRDTSFSVRSPENPAAEKPQSKAASAAAAGPLGTPREGEAPGGGKKKRNRRNRNRNKNKAKVNAN